MPLRSFKRDGQLKLLIKKFVKPYITSKNNSSFEPLHSWVLVAHYKFTVGILFCLFVSLVGGWFTASPMDCYLKYDRTEIEDYQEQLCLSYPYTYNSDHERVYALHYRWVHWAILALVPLYCIPLYLKNHFEIDILQRYLHLISVSDKEDPERRNRILAVVDGFVGFGAAELFFQKLLLLLITILVDVAAFVFIDVCLQNRFARLFPLDYPFTRWPQFLNDTLSLAFPPFVECKLGKEMMLLNQMEETFGCSLNLMKVYDKIFVAMWLWMVALSLWTIFTILYYIFLGLSPIHQRSLLKTEECDEEVKLCMKILSVGDVILLNCLSSLLNIDENQLVLRKVADNIRTYKKGPTLEN